MTTQKRLSRGRVAFWLIVIAAVGLAIHVPLAPRTGYWGDIEIYMAWTHQVTHNGIHTAYDPNFIAPPNTTPGLLYPFWAIGQTFRQFFSPDFPPTWIDRTNQVYLRMLLRLPALLCIGLIAAVAFRYVRRRWGDAAALLAVAAFVLNPAITFDAGVLGQTGTVHALFMLLGVIGLAEGRPALGWAALAAGMLTKPQADLFLPLFFVLTWRRYGLAALIHSLLAAALVGLVMLAPFIAHGTLGQMWARVGRPADYHPVLAATAHNLWWLVSFGQGKLSDLLGPTALGVTITYRAIGLGLVGLAYLLALARTWFDRAPRTLYMAAAYLFTAFCILATQIHENHLIPLFPLLLLAVPPGWLSAKRRAEIGGAGQVGNLSCADNRYLTWLYVAFSITAALNMALHFPQLLHIIVPQNPDIWGGAELFLPRWLNSLAQVGLFAYWTFHFARETWAVLPIRKIQ